MDIEVGGLGYKNSADRAGTVGTILGPVKYSLLTGLASWQSMTTRDIRRRDIRAVTEWESGQDRAEIGHDRPALHTYTVQRRLLYKRQIQSPLTLELNRKTLRHPQIRPGSSRHLP